MVVVKFMLFLRPGEPAPYSTTVPRPENSKIYFRYLNAFGESAEKNCLTLSYDLTILKCMVIISKFFLNTVSTV